MTTTPMPLTEAEAILDRLVDEAHVELTFAHPEGERLIVEHQRYPWSFTTATLYRADRGGRQRVAFRIVNPQNPQAPRELFLADLGAREEAALRVLAAAVAAEIAAKGGGK